jgi:hypothetical protein
MDRMEFVRQAVEELGAEAVVWRLCCALSKQGLSAPRRTQFNH